MPDLRPIAPAPPRRSCKACGLPAVYRHARRCQGCGSTEFEDEEPATPGRRLLRIGHLTDLHLESGRPAAAGTLERWLRALRAVDVDLLVVSGDVAERASDRTALLEARVLLERARFPAGFVVVPGNHDVGAPGERVPFDEVFPGTWPRVERRGEVDVILVDSTRSLADGDRSALERGFAWWKCRTEGRVDPEALQRLEAELRPGAELVVVLHHHLAGQSQERVFSSVPWLTDGAIGTMRAVKDGAALRAWCAARDVRLVLHGHKHRRHVWQADRGRMWVANAGSSTEPDPDGAYRALVFDLQEGGTVDGWVATL